MPASPVQVPGEGPPTITYSISGCAHSAGLGVPRSQAARIERTSSTFADGIDPSVPGRDRRLQDLPALGVVDHFDQFSGAADTALTPPVAGVLLPRESERQRAPRTSAGR